MFLDEPVVCRPGSAAKWSANSAKLTINSFCQAGCGGMAAKVLREERVVLAMFPATGSGCGPVPSWLELTRPAGSQSHPPELGKSIDRCSLAGF